MPITRPYADQLLTSLVKDHYLQQDLNVEDQHLLHVANKFVDQVDLGKWAKQSRDLAFLSLREKVSHEFGCDTRQADKIAVRLERYLAYAVYRKADKQVREQASKILAQTAGQLEKVALEPDACIKLLGELKRQVPDEPKALEAELEAYGLSREKATGLALGLINKDLSKVASDLKSDQGLCMHKTKPLGLAEFQAGLLVKSQELKTLAGLLPKERSIRVFEDFPALTEGLLNAAKKVDSKSFLVHAIEKHAEWQRLERNELNNLAAIRHDLPIERDRLTKMILADVGTSIFSSFAGIKTFDKVLSVAQLGSSLDSVIENSDRKLTVKRLSLLSKGMTHQQFYEAQLENKRELGKSLILQFLYRTAMAIGI
ncbi:MAG: hypothetical protein JRJ87_15340 [Deltaproteobacteria bacterium]|nr:hypothetical protein [Deltaproteobacteria bacterium]